MSKMIFKYPFYTPNAFFELTMPIRSELLDVQWQFNSSLGTNTSVLWALVEKTADLELRRFYMAGTGQPIPYEVQSWDYVGTLQEPEEMGGLVWHVFAEPFGRALRIWRATTPSAGRTGA